MVQGLMVKCEEISRKMAELVQKGLGSMRQPHILNSTWVHLLVLGVQDQYALGIRTLVYLECVFFRVCVCERDAQNNMSLLYTK